jgi:hypothetical protein
MEKLTDMTWSVISYALLIIYHFTVLQGFGLVSNARTIVHAIGILNNDIWKYLLLVC